MENFTFYLFAFGGCSTTTTYYTLSAKVEIDFESPPRKFVAASLGPGLLKRALSNTLRHYDLMNNNEVVESPITDFSQTNYVHTPLTPVQT